MSYNYAKLRATVVAATSGPWEADIKSGTSRTVRQTDGGRGICTTFVQGQPKTPAGWESQRHQNNANSEYIAACDPETIRNLLDERDAQAAEIERLRQPWQPIETAPIGNNPDGFIWLMLAWGPEGDQSTGNGMRWRDKWFAAPAFYCLGQERKYAFKETEIQPTHWMPLPELPAALSGEPA